MKESLSDVDTKVSWNYDFEASQPLHYTFTFPSCSYAMEGDTVQGMLHLHSNLPFPVKIEHVDLDMSVGSVHFEAAEMSCTNHPNETITVSANVLIPNGCMKNVDTKTLERQTVKKPRRNTFGLTKIGGGVYVKDMENKVSGGLCSSCLGAEITMLLPGSSDSRLTVRLKNHYRGSFPLSHGSKDAADEQEKKRISLEEDNFVYSAWSRPDYFPMHSGPRCMRVLRAQSQLEITDLTSPLVKNKAMIGTVNKFVLKLKAGSMEQCKNVKMRVTCSSWLDMGSSEDSVAETGGAVASDQTDPEILPVLVTPTSENAAFNSFFQKADDVLPGWKKITGDTQHGQTLDEWVPITDNLHCGMETFCSFALYKALPPNGHHEKFQCKTKFTVDISYNQIRLDQKNVGQDKEPVIHTYRGIIDWCSPFDAEFRVLPRKQGSSPSGSRHPSNAVGNLTATASNIAVLSGNLVVVTCSLQSPGAADNLSVEVGNVEFSTDSLDKDCKVSLVQHNQKEPGNILYEPKPDDFCNKLKIGSKLKLAYTVQPELMPDGGSVDKSNRLQITSTALGYISILFTPLPLYHPEKIEQDRGMNVFENNHGPLPIENLPAFKQKGPFVYVEAAPFEASFHTIPSIPKVASPFEVRYKLLNKTSLQQRIKVSMIENEGDSIGILVSGIINGEVILGPMEEKMLRYSLLVTKIGKTILPTLNVSSLRYNSWIIRGGEEDCIYVLP